jgi:hypothetical protein
MSLHVDVDGWLGTDSPGDPEIMILPSHRNYHLRKPPCGDADPVVSAPIGHIWHTTDVVQTMENLAHRIAVDSHGASWNAGIGRNGVIYQSVPFILGAWHVGNPGKIEGQFAVNVNKCTTGTEMENPGRLKRDPGSGALADAKFYSDPFWRLGPADATGKRHPDRSLGFDPALHINVVANDAAITDPSHQFVVVADGKGGWWAKFTPAQLAAIEAYVRALAAWCPALNHASAWRWGHVDFPGTTGKEDPGPMFIAPRDEILGRVFGSDDGAPAPRAA